MTWDKVIHIEGRVAQGDDKDESMVDVRCYPLPDDEALHKEIYAACRTVISELLVKKGFVGVGVETNPKAPPL